MSHWLYAAYRRNLSNSQAAASWESPSHVSDSSGRLHPSSSLPIFLWAPPQSPLPAGGHCFSILARSPCESRDFLSFLSLGNISLFLESQEPLPYTRKKVFPPTEEILGLNEHLLIDKSGQWQSKGWVSKCQSCSPFRQPSALLSSCLCTSWPPTQGALSTLDQANLCSSRAF